MGVVYLARDIRLNRRCALKMILSGTHAHSTEIERFQSEAQAIARLQHPGIVQVFEIGQHDEKPFMALELCSGGSLDSVLAKNPLEPRKAAELVQALSLAMQAAHEAKVVHRDLKPANVLLTESGETKITDFGLAKKLDEQGATRTGSIMGTPSYMPPEQADGKKDIGPSADIYSLGAILYECLAGRPPFRAATPLDTLLQVLSEEPVSLRQLNAKTPQDLETIVNKCLQKEPTKRYASAKELADDLGRFLAGEPILARPIGTLERAMKWCRRYPVVSGLIVAVVLLVSIGVGSSWMLTAWALAEKNKAGEEAVAARIAEGKAEEEAKAAREAEAIAQAEKSRAEDQLERAEWAVYAGKLLLSESAFSELRMPQAFGTLDECQWNLRGWEHRHLKSRFDSSRQTLTGHNMSVVGVAFSADGRKSITVGYDGTVKIWDSEQGIQLHSWRNRVGSFNAIALSPDQKRLVAGGYIGQDGPATIWNTEDGKLLLTLDGHGRQVESVAFSPDGASVLTGSVDNTAILWNARTGEKLHTLKGHRSPVNGVAFSPDGKSVATASWDRTAKIWDVTGKELRTLTGHGERVNSVAFSPDGRTLLTGSWDHTARLWDAQKGTQIRTFNGSSFVHCVAFSPCGRQLATGDHGGIVTVWDTEQGHPLLRNKGHADALRAIVFSPDGRRLLTSSADRTAKVWDALPTKQEFTVYPPGSVYCAVFSSDARSIAAALDDHTARIYSASTGEELLTLKGHKSILTGVAFSRDNQRVLTGSVDKTAKIWDSAKGTELFTLSGHKARINAVAFSPDDQRIVTASHDKTAKAWDTQNGKELLTFNGHRRQVTGVVFHPDGQRIITCSTDGTARLWNAQTGAEIRSFTKNGHELNAVTVSEDGKHILTGGDQGNLILWNIETGAIVQSFSGHKSAVNAVALSPDGQRVVSCGFDQTVRVWETRKGTELLSLKGYTAAMSSASFSRDGQRILTSSFGRAVRVWNSRPPGNDPMRLEIPDGVTRTAFSSDGQRLFAWSIRDVVSAWSLRTGNRVTVDDPPARPAAAGAVATSPDGRYTARATGAAVHLSDSQQKPAPNAWPWPDLAERTRYHREQADLAEKQKAWFAVAFHLGRLLLDDPNSDALKRRKEQAMDQLTKEKSR
jgi:WD40 repeat protein